MDIREKVAKIFSACQTLNGDHSDPAWCILSKPLGIKTNLMDDRSDSNSVEYKLVLRARMGVDDIVKSLTTSSSIALVSTDLDLASLIQLLWSLAYLRLHDSELVSTIENRIRIFLESANLSQVELVMLVWADAMLNQRDSTLEISLTNLDEFAIDQLVNLLFATSLIGRDFDLIRSIRDHLSRASAPSFTDIQVRYNRVIMFACVVIGESVSSESLVKLRSKCRPRPSWKLSFQLCLTSHAVIGSRQSVEVNPIIESVFPFDVSTRHRRQKILLEVSRPESVVRRIKDWAMVGVDGYTRMVRVVLASLGYRILSFTITEWTDCEDQMKLVKNRIKNCVRAKRLFSGTERDIPGQGDDSHSDSDMSY
jgi:hypothetical protein